MTSAVYPFGYCTNVHSGTSLDEARDNLLRYAVRVRDEVIPGGALPVGLWLAEAGARGMIADNQVHAWREWLEEHRLVPYTLNGFPQGDFHQRVVKHAVYEPTWTCDSRSQYTLCLAEILDAWLPAGGVGSISTLPLGWPHAPWPAENFKQAADHLLDVARFLARLNQRSGKQIVLAIEPEPGCVLNTSREIVEFFEHYLFRGPDAAVARRHLGVCHDVCHSGVMFEPQGEALERYRQAGIRVGKMQISSAVHVPWDAARDDPRRLAATSAQLRNLSEPKFLHQTTRRSARGDGCEALLDDLPRAVDRWLPGGSYPTQPWRIHFHVPIDVERFGSLETTRDDIREAMAHVESHRDGTVDDDAWFTGHYEVETYAWTVLPPELSCDDLAAGITREMRYFHDLHRQLIAVG